MPSSNSSACSASKRTFFASTVSETVVPAFPRNPWAFLHVSQVRRSYIQSIRFAILKPLGWEVDELGNVTELVGWWRAGKKQFEGVGILKRAGLRIEHASQAGEFPAVDRVLVVAPFFGLSRATGAN